MKKFSGYKTLSMLKKRTNLLICSLFYNMGWYFSQLVNSIIAIFG